MLERYHGPARSSRSPASPPLAFSPVLARLGPEQHIGRGMSADVDLDHVTIRFGGFTAVESVSLKISGGEFFSILGPSGCGKTTLLRTISGFLEPTEGAVRIGGQDMSGIGSNKRPTALIFQNLALFPLMVGGREHRLRPARAR